MSERKAFGKPEVVERLSKLYSIPQTEATRRVDGVFRVIEDIITEGHDLTLVGIMGFKHSYIREREVYVPTEGKKVLKPAVRTLNVNMSRPIKDKIKQLGVDDLIED